MSWLPKSPKARRRLILVAAIAPVLALAVALTLWGLRGQVVYFYSPSDLAARPPETGQPLRLGGLVEAGSVSRDAAGHILFGVTDGAAEVQVVYDGALPDLFREGQGVVVEGRLETSGRFRADQVLAKHDETYMPREVADALKKQGVWREGEAS
ncbi:cytochrome c maturation protein CcmE [Brevundimonas sp. 2R-24]|uniref:Cytochrome c-type biogenesis protein CcmE n=1 Tax=Peiella sedimenti TaxID=3061083 RepID=A0ABT8SHT1_9CAUL|nr:cytochrome c maturation protein CcmE [Caulobacteraceae bacterium XZ-24]